MDNSTELDIVVLIRPLPEHGLVAGDVGTVVHAYDNGAALEVEFVEGGGATVAVATLAREDVRIMQSREILHVRAMVA